MKMNEPRYKWGTWKPKENSRPRLIVSNDGGDKWVSVAVFSNDENIEVFQEFLLGLGAQIMSMTKEETEF